MKRYLTVDGGTTNTRISLVCDGAVRDTKKLSVGARNGADALKGALREGITDLLAAHKLDAHDVEAIIASGMITSEYGLCNLPHISLPAGLCELHASMHRAEFPEITSIPWYFIRGVRSVTDSIDGTDVMRGEETELMGIIDLSKRDALYVLPGSHSKHISVDGEGRITAFRTMLSGELFAAVMQNTILRDAADFEHNAIVEEKLFFGYEYCLDHGVNESFFKTRILKNLFGATKEECYSFLLGVALCDEVRAIGRAEENSVVLGGQKQFREALAAILKKYTDKQTLTLTDDTVAASTAIGAVRIFEG
jgi:2-dehydro-3-deoxygalactonokinase